MRLLLLLMLFIAWISPPRLSPTGDASGQAGDASGQTGPGSSQAVSDSGITNIDDIQRKLEGPVDAKDIAAASTWASDSRITEWLGPLSPVALSPFFGVTMLSGLALWNPDWLAGNALLSSAGPLGNPWMFGTFAILTLITSLPRLTKVSKPFAQAVDRLEAYAVIIILLTIKLILSFQSGDEAELAMFRQPVMELGIISFSVDTLLAIAMVINILVVNSVKFFFEFLVWLTPIPFLDAVFEICNKTLCATLMAIYAYSPTLATLINLLILFLAALIFRWASRRVRFYRTMLLDPLIASMFAGFGKATRGELVVFPQESYGPFAAKERLRLCRSVGALRFENANWWAPTKSSVVPDGAQCFVRRGWIMYSLEIDEGGKTSTFKFSRRYGESELSRLLETLEVEMESTTPEHSEDRKAAFA